MATRLVNIFIGLMLAWYIYMLFYFYILPRLIKRFGRTVKTGRKYEREINEILKEDPK